MFYGLRYNFKRQYFVCTGEKCVLVLVGMSFRSSTCRGTESQYVSQPSLKTVISLPWLPECLDRGCPSLYPSNSSTTMMLVKSFISILINFHLILLERVKYSIIIMLSLLSIKKWFMLLGGCVGRCIYVYNCYVFLIYWPF